MRRGPILHPWPAGHGYCARLRPHHVRHRGGDDRLVRHGDALLRHAEGASGIAEPRRREDRRHHLQDLGPCRRHRQGAPGGTGARRRGVAGTLRLPLGRPVQPGARSRHGGPVSRRDPAEGGAQSGALLLHVRAEILLHGDHPAGPRLCREAEREAGRNGRTRGGEWRSHDRD